MTWSHTQQKMIAPLNQLLRVAKSQCMWQAECHWWRNRGKYAPTIQMSEWSIQKGTITESGHKGEFRKNSTYIIARAEVECRPHDCDGGCGCGAAGCNEEAAVETAWYSPVTVDTLPVAAEYVVRHCKSGTCKQDKEKSINPQCAKA